MLRDLICNNFEIKIKAVSELIYDILLGNLNMILF